MGFLDGAPLISGGVGGDWARQAKHGQTQTLGRLGERLCWKLGKRGRKQIGNWREAHFVLLDCSLGGKASPGGDLLGRRRSRWPRAREEGGDSGEISINDGQRCFEAGLHNEQKIQLMLKKRKHSIRMV